MDFENKKKLSIDCVEHIIDARPLPSDAGAGG